MKRLLYFFALSLSLVVVSNNVAAQIKEVNFIKGGINDAQILFKEYLTPYANILGADLNGGWYNTAKPHKLGGFDVTVSLSTAWAPPSARTFDLAGLGLTGVPTGSTTIAPTIAGKKDDIRPVMLYEVDHPVNAGEKIKVAEYTVPNGTGINAIPLPMAQLGIGLPFGTEVTGRFLPSIDFGNNGNIGLWGVGLKHSILQWIPGLKRLPVLDVSAQGGYTSLLTFANVNIKPDAIADDQTTDPLVFKGQKIELGVKGYTINLIASQTLPVITFYQGIGYSSSSTNVALKGNFPISNIDGSGNVVVTDDDIINDPFNVEIQNSKDLRLNAGLRLKLGVFTIHFDYTKANYSVFTAGLGVSFR